MGLPKGICGSCGQKKEPGKPCIDCSRARLKRARQKAAENRKAKINSVDYLATFHWEGDVSEDPIAARNWVASMLGGQRTPPPGPKAIGWYKSALEDQKAFWTAYGQFVNRLEQNQAPDERANDRVPQTLAVLDEVAAASREAIEMAKGST